MAETPCLVNGVPETRIPVADRGLQYGDGLFETIAVTGGVPEFWERHMARLGAGCMRLSLPAPDAELLKAEALKLCADSARGVLKIIVTRGAGGRGYRLPDEIHPTRIVSLHPAPDYPAEIQRRGIQMRLCDTRLAIQPRLAGLKHLNRLEQILARAEWSDSTILEGLMLAADSAAIEGTMTNLFVVSGGVLRTPDLSRCGVAGILRAVVIDLAREAGIPCRVERFGLVDVLVGDEVFLTNSVVGIWPVGRLGDREFEIGSVTRRLMMALARMPKA
jgi:4-amino-4-deoxychorismate lyase